MKNIKRLFFVVLLSLSMSLFLINCGGSGSGGGGIEYEGLTTQTQIDAGNAETVAMNSYENGNSMLAMQGAGGIFGAVSANGNGQIPKPYSVAFAQFVKDFLEQADLSSGSESHVMGAVLDSESMSGDCGGSVTYSGTADETSGSFNITATFSSYCSNEDGLTGTVTANGTMKMNGSIQSDPMQLQLNVTFSRFEFTESGTDVSAAVSGSMNMTINSNSAVITMSLVMKDDAIGKTYKVENLVINMNTMTSPATFSMSGRFYDPDYGYVDIETEVEFRVDVSDSNPSNGTMVITGKSNTKARFIAVDSSTYRVEADTDGNGYVDVTGLKYW